MNAPRLSLRNVTISYSRHPAVHHLSGDFLPGSMTAIVGPNGAGKSTLLKALMGQCREVEGTIDRGALTPRDFAYLPQLAEIERQFPLSVADVVAMGAWHRIGGYRGMTRDIRAEAARAIAEVGLKGFEKRPIGALSGGQMQRTLFARLLLQDARVILLDEPFAGIDTATTRDLLTLIRGWHAAGRTVIAVLHDMDLVRATFPQTLLLSRRPVGWGSTALVLTEDNLRRARESGGGPPVHHAPLCSLPETAAGLEAAE